MVVWEVRENPPVATPVEIFTGSPQLYTVPAGTFVGTALKVEPLQNGEERESARDKETAFIPIAGESGPPTTSILLSQRSGSMISQYPGSAKASSSRK
jgi:hypothetical protein